jgi:hypothetical protein
MKPTGEPDGHIISIRGNNKKKKRKKHTKKWSEICCFGGVKISGYRDHDGRE